MLHLMRALLLLIAGFHTSAHACSADSDCTLGNRSYRIHLPENATIGQPLAAILFAHGYRGSAKGVMGNGSLRSLADELGVALIAINARGNDWHIDGVPSQSIIHGTDDFDYVDAVLDDAITRFDIDAERIMATGFSAGGMMVWNLACRMSERFAGFAPIAGTFWHPVPVTCPAPPASLVHIHGTTDKIVPLSGRPIADTRQGNVYHAIEMYAEHGGFMPDSRYEAGELACDRQRNSDLQTLDLCLFEGGHSFKTEFVRFAWRQLMAER